MQDSDFRSTVPRLIIDGNEIDNVRYAKLLGVTISSDLTWNKHVENIVAKSREESVHGSFHVRSTNGLRVTPPISMKVGTRADNA